MTTDELQKGLEIHVRLAQVCARINQRRVWFRSPARATLELPEHFAWRGRVLMVDRDRIVGALLVKLVNTKESVVILAKAEQGDDAYALARVITENAVIVAWLLKENWLRRIDAYGTFNAGYQKRLHELHTKFWPEKPAFPPLDEEALAVAEQNASWSKWARVPKPGATGKKTIGTFDEMCQDLTPPKAEGDRSSLLHEVAYYHASMWVHSAPPSIQEIFSDLIGDRTLQIAPRSTSKLAGLAVHVSNAALWFALKAFDEWAGTQQSEELDAIKADMEQRLDSSK